LNEVLTDKIWREVAKRACSAPTRKTAIAYVTTDDIGLRAGDVLVTDASPRAIRSGQTRTPSCCASCTAPASLSTAERAFTPRFALFGKRAIVGSANMSGSNLIEASVITDNPVVVSGVAAFIKKLSTVRTKLSDHDIQKLCAIEVVRTGHFTGRRRASNPVRRLGKATWKLGVREVKDPTERQQKRIDRSTRELKERLGTNEDDLGWIQWGKKSRFGRECRAGDTLIQILNWRDRKRSIVTRRCGCCSRIRSRTPPPNLPRLRALALFGRRSVERAEPLCCRRPKNHHTFGLMGRSNLPDYSITSSAAGGT
jgi:hypothetical protein